MERINISKHTKVLVPATNYDLDADKRLLIPFTSGEKIGFVNQNKEIVVKPQYCMYYGECYSDEDYIRVAVNHPYGGMRKSGAVASYQRYLYGLINYNGEVVIPVEYYCLIPAIGNKRMYTLQNKDNQYGVIDLDGTEIVPFGKYNWIDGFDRGLARVKIGTPNSLIDKGSKWGLIDEAGKEILPVGHDEIYPFYCRKHFTAKVVKGSLTQNLVLSNLLSKNESHHMDSNDYIEHDDYGNHYGEYAGYYAQDVEGYSDDIIDDVFEGDPEAYWNID